MRRSRSPSHPVTLGQHDAALLRLAAEGVPLWGISLCFDCDAVTAGKRLRVLQGAVGRLGRKVSARTIRQGLAAARASALDGVLTPAQQRLWNAVDGTRPQKAVADELGLSFGAFRQRLHLARRRMALHGAS